MSLLNFGSRLLATETAHLHRANFCKRVIAVESSESYKVTSRSDQLACENIEEAAPKHLTFFYCLGTLCGLFKAPTRSANLDMKNTGVADKLDGCFDRFRISDGSERKTSQELDVLCQNIPVPFNDPAIQTSIAASHLHEECNPRHVSRNSSKDSRGVVSGFVCIHPMLAVLQPPCGEDSYRAENCLEKWRPRPDLAASKTLDRKKRQPRQDERDDVQARPKCGLPFILHCCTTAHQEGSV